jgi:small lipoprotein (TIGR04452 family)
MEITKKTKIDKNKLSYREIKLIKSVRMKTIKAHIFLFLFIGCSFSPWETPGTISGKHAKSELNQLLYLHTIATNAMAFASGIDLSSKSYKAACGKALPSSFYTSLPLKIKDNKLYKRESIKDCKKKINIYASIVLGYAVNEDGCIFNRTVTTIGKYDCHIEEADTLQLGKNGIL